MRFSPYASKGFTATVVGCCHLLEKVMLRLGTILPWTLSAGLHLLAQRPAIEPVLRAELAFAHLADQKGIRTAFLTWLDGDARVFTPA